MVETSNGLSLGYAPYRGWPPVSPNLKSFSDGHDSPRISTLANVRNLKEV